MTQTEGNRLARYSAAVRESTLKRLRKVPPGKEDWSPATGAMTCADIAHHLLEADRWLFEKLKNPSLTKMAGETGEAAGKDFPEVIAELMRSGKQRSDLLATVTDEFLDSPIFDDRFGDVTVWWVIVRGNLDHEAHHRGQLAAYLNILQGSSST